MEKHKNANLKMKKALNANSHYSLFLTACIFVFTTPIALMQLLLNYKRIVVAMFGKLSVLFDDYIVQNSGGGRVVRWSWENFQCRGVLLVWIRVGQGPIALAVGAGGGGLDIFTLIYPFSPLSPSLWETTRYRLKYCLKGSLSPKTTNQPIAQNSWLE